MYKIEKKPYGFKLTFSDMIDADEMTKWVKESKAALANVSGSFGVLVDMKSLKPLSPDAQAPMQEGQKLYKQKGMERSAVLLENVMIKMQFTRIAKETGIYEWERYVVGSEQTALDWIEKGVDPDK